ncbi:hypothetical protein TCAL_00050 [Tigriopus californicus]|uniref:DUF155 domain-containing protein n=2 Tax=Tigriopus californicus TaxID=6832 RepID=A0A553PFG7_TIGCA|nr:hypothetical protein TCAL_00050 [Tigriopus californicus]|eukprot:TCALIF_00050-PA protein Name:"Similar to Rmnd1 Required for meiotic nuclear division protein 1 homolog (Mus musculus)" AED:0.01 eAED:0.01 QI:0/-1/0/1/-1/1/1/0/362
MWPRSLANLTGSLWLKRGHLIASQIVDTACTRAFSSTTTLPLAANLRLPLTEAGSPLRYRPRLAPPAKKRPPKGLDPTQDNLAAVVGYSTAGSYDLLTLADRLERQGVYETHYLVDELTAVCLYATAKYKVDPQVRPQEFFFYEHGSVVFWNTPELERESVIQFLRRVSMDPLESAVIFEESEMMQYALTAEPTRLQRDLIHLNERDSVYDKYAFSDAIAASVKLGTLESALDRIIDSIEHVSVDLKRGQKISMSRREVLQKTGEIFALKHAVNLAGDLLDTPDFYWDRENLETLYHATCAHLALSKRTRIVNEKLTHCYELMDLITNHLNDAHHTRLEWFIIILIMIEVGFELLHFVERFI